MNILFFILLFVMCLALIIVVLLCTTFVIPHCCNCMRSLCQIAKNKLMYNSVIRGLLEAYFLMSIAAVYQVRNMGKFDTEGWFNFTISVLTLVYLVLFPIWSLCYLLKNFARLETPVMQLKYGTLYQNVDPKRPVALLFTLYFCVRRLVFALLIVLLSE